MSQATYLASLRESVDRADLSLYSDQVKREWAALRELVHQREVWQAEQAELLSKQPALEHAYKTALADGQVVGAAARKAARRELDETEERLKDLEVLLAGWPVFVEKKHARCQELIELETAAAEARVLAEVESLVLPPLVKLAQALPRLRALAQEGARWGGRIGEYTPRWENPDEVGVSALLGWLAATPPLVKMAQKDAKR